MSRNRNQSLPPTPVRRSVEALIPELKYIRIDEESIEKMASDLALEEFPLPKWQAPVFPDTETEGVSPADVIDFLFVGNTINFQFRDYKSGNKFTAEYAGTEWAGAFGMWACLKREFEQNPAILSGKTLASLSIADVESLFEPSDSTPMPMLRERHEILTRVGEKLNNQYDNRFSNLVGDATPRLYDNGDGIVDRLISEFSSFRDAGMVTLESGTSLEVSFWKRAQLAAGMAYGRFYGDSNFQINDPSAFSIFVDYNLPNVLRGKGVLEYSDNLAELVDSRTMIEAGSREEVEIRAAAVYAADELIHRLNEIREASVYAPHMDYKLFMMRDEIETPVHITRTTAY